MDLEEAETRTATPPALSLAMQKRLSKEAAGSKLDDETSEMDLDADGEVDAPGETASGAELEEGKVTSTSSTATSTVGVATKSTAKPATPQSEAAQRAKSALLQIQTIMALRAPIFELPVSATLVDPAALAHLTDSVSDPLSLHTLFPDLPLYSDFQLATDIPSDKRIEESSAWAGRLTNVSKHFDSRPLLVSTIMPSRTRAREGGWDPMANNWLDETRETVPELSDQPVSSSSTFLSLFLPRCTGAPY